MLKALRVLLVEDLESDAILLAGCLSQGGYAPQWERVDTLEALRAALEKGSWDILISDHSMPHISALSALELLKEKGLDIPAIIYSGTIGEAAAVAAMKAGARDYIMKGDSTRLLSAIDRELRESQARRKASQIEAQLRQAQKMEVVGRLAGGVAHDFNNLLTAILGNCVFLLDQLPPGDSKRRDVEEIKAAGERAADLTRQLLAFSRKQIFELKVMDMNAVVVNMDRLLRRLIGEDIELITVAGKGLGRIKADPGQIEQIIVNMAVNSRDAMPHGGRLILETANLDLAESDSGDQFEIAPGPYVMLKISDTGCGMDATALSHIFEPFFTTKKPGKSTGLGLSMVYGIVKQSLGYIWVDSAPGRGTTFRICFPRVEEPAEPLVAAAAPLKSLKGSETILLVEDDERLRSLMQRVLSQHGYKILAGSGGGEALRICKQYQGTIHLLVTDVIMSHMNGVDLAKEIKKLRPDIRQIFISGYMDDIVGQKGALKPGIHFIQKPFSPATLANKVREVLEKKRSPR